MIEEERITNKKTGEELSLAIIDNAYEGYEDDGGIFDCAIEIKRNGLSPKQ